MKKKVNLLILIFAGVFSSACLLLKGIYTNSSWEVPNTEMEVTVSVTKRFGDQFERKMCLEGGKAGRHRIIALADGSKDYARINIYRMSDNQYILRDLYRSYLLDTTEKTLQQTLTYIPDNNHKFIGAFDFNNNGGWRYISESERKEIPLEQINR